MFVGKAEEDIRQLFEDHIKAVDEALNELVVAVTAFTTADPMLEKYSYHIHKLEHRADELCREIRAAINKGAFLPFYREDYLQLSKFIDKSADRAVDVARGLVLRQPLIPDDLKEDFVELAREVLETFRPFREIATLFDKPRKAAKLCEEVSEREQKCDAREWKLLRRVYHSTTLSRADQIITSESITRLSSVADVIENAADRVKLLVIKQTA